MKKTLVFLIIFSSLLSGVSLAANKLLFIEGKAVHGDCDISMSREKGTVISGDINEGPTISWVAIIAVGKISLTADNPILDKALKDKTPITISYVDNNINRAFSASNVTEKKALSGGKYKTEYTFKSLCTRP